MRLDRGKLLPRLYVLPRKCLVTFTSQPEPQLKCGDEDHPTRLEAASLLIPSPSLFILTFPIPSACRLLLPPVATTARFPSSAPARLNFTLDHVSNTGKGAGEAHRVDFVGAAEHGGSAERQCCACAGWRWWRTAVHGPDVCAIATMRCGLLTTPSYPLITLSTRAQVESKRAQSSTLNAARRIIKREGVAGLYAGLDSALFGISVTNFVYYYCTTIHS